jgi:tRNA U34 5-methylaminomethyl-2-thiouridine-forming methyltransferase MnmC
MMAIVCFFGYSESMAQLPPHHQIIETEDGSLTLFSERFQEACHSTTGAKSETLLHYIRGCKIIERAPLQDAFTILEVGFGLGMGFMTTLEALSTSTRSWHFLSLEIDRDLVEWFRKENEKLISLEWKKENILEGQRGSCTLTLLVGNARQTLSEYLRSSPLLWNAIYQDAFSPKKNPILWTKEWFSFLKEHSSQDVILSTYSASSSIRKSLFEAGWVLSKGEKFGPKRSSTRAALLGESDPEILLHLERSPIAALRDENFNDEEIKKASL